MYRRKRRRNLPGRLWKQMDFEKRNSKINFKKKSSGKEALFLTCMNIIEVINDTRQLVLDAFTEMDQWFAKDPELISYKPKDGGWSVYQNLEHVGLTSHFLLILIEKGKIKALANKDNLNLEEELAH